MHNLHFKSFIEFIGLAILINITFVVLMLGASIQHSEKVIQEQQHTNVVVQQIHHKY
ncbi:hypothetical protein N6G96_07185 [Pediococcus inopinatus]|uniref:Uncharacterized protein n=1 Tax=Pediococcus inopinatus TaxID=114090 RepID=A0ABZ0Q4J5_9LACO|nr:hypothetical protein [Pediococcus inopinatus]WPC19283.1 hypothetical protein N6G95_08610 [Pediococcus inopinatus]WPC21073.1 hypothetical protein N6G96_07185 [Pediococcus inopinatus]